MAKPMISVIVPIYNMERYLRKALDSIRNQTFQNWECLLVDDGSSDASGDICDEYAAADLRFKAIHKPNGGVSSARNAGLDNASGDHIAFVDPDDWCDPQFLASLHKLITESDADIVQVGFTREYDGFALDKPLVKTTRVLNRHEAMVELLKDKALPSYLWNKLFCRKVVTSRFPVGKVFEDIYTLTEWFRNADKVLLSPLLLYHYRMRGKSIVNSFNAANRYDYIEACRHRAEIVNRLFPTEFDTKAFDRYMLLSRLSGAKSIARYERDMEQRRRFIEKISCEARKYHKPSIGEIGLKRWFRSSLLRSRPQAFARLMRTVYLIDFQTRRRIRHLYP